MPTNPSTRPRKSISAGALCILLFSACAVEVRRPEPEALFAMEKEFLNLPHLAKPSGYTHVVTSPPGKMIFLSGQGGADEKGELPKDFRTQCENTFRNIQKALEMAGAGFDDVVKMGYFLTDVGQLEVVREVRANYINMEKPPASTLVQSPLIGDLLIEIDVIAIVDE